MAKLDDLIQQKQQRDEDWKSRKAAEREELGQLSDDAVMRVTSEPGAYLHYLDTQAINPRYSASNVLLAMAQNPEITYINSLEVWNRLGRSVNRDENGMKIRVSDTYVKDGREYHGYKIGRVFDISQTHGKAGVPALSLKDNTPEMDAALRRLLDSSPVPVVTSSTMYQDAVYDPKTQSITVKKMWWEVTARQIWRSVRKVFSSTHRWNMPFLRYKPLHEMKSEIRPYLRKIAEVQKAQMPPRRSVGGKKLCGTRKPPIGGTLPRKEQQSGTLYLHHPTVEVQRPLRIKAIRAHRSRAVLPPRADRP